MMHLGLCVINYALAVVHFFPTRKKKNKQSENTGAALLRQCQEAAQHLQTHAG